MAHGFQSALSGSRFYQASGFAGGYDFIFISNQKNFLRIPEFPLCYWLRDKFFKILQKEKRLDTVKQGIKAAGKERFLRLHWEVPAITKRWFNLVKGGTYCKWVGLEHYCIDWENNGERIKANKKARVQNVEYYFQEGITYTAVARGSMGARILNKGSIFDSASPGIFPSGNLHSWLAVLNTRYVSHILRALCPTLGFSEGAVSIIPEVSIPSSKRDKIDILVRECLKEKSWYVNGDLTERGFNAEKFKCDGDSLEKKSNLFLLQEFFTLMKLHTIEGVIEEQIAELNEIRGKDLSAILDELGTPGGFYPLIEGYDAIPKTDICEIPKEAVEYLQKHERINPSGEENEKIKSRLRALYEAGSGAKVENVVEEEENETDSDEEEEAESIIGKKIPIPTETFLEELSVKMEIHPISIYWLLKEMREKEGLMCWPECKRYAEDYLSVMMLRMLGFRWLKQVEANELVPDWVDKDGIIPITEHTEEKTLLERIRDRIGAEFGENKISDIEAEFDDILFNAACKEAEVKGKTPPKKKLTLAQWLEREFFKRHTNQFKKRPIAWQLTSSNGTFQVLIFCHKISLDMFKNLKNRHLARVQSYYGSLLERARRGGSVPGGLTAGKLSDIEFELEEFSNKLDKLIAMPYEPLIEDGVRVNIAPLQKLGLLASPVLAAKDVDRAIADRNRWREDDKEQTTIWKLS